MTRSYRKIQPSIEDVEVFLTFARIAQRRGTASFQEVAKQLKKSVSRVSATIDRLETRFTALVVRDRSGENTLTANGAALAEQFERIWKLHQSLAVAVPTSEVTVATTNSILVHVLPQAVKTFLSQRDSGSVGLRFREMTHDQIVNGVRTRAVDFGIAPASETPKDRNVVERDLISSMDMVLVMPPDDPIAVSLASRERREITLTEIANQGTKPIFVLPANAYPVLSLNVLRGILKTQRKVVEVDHSDTILAYASLGIGIGVVPGWYWILEDLRQRQLIDYAPVKDLGKRRIVTLLPREGEALSEPASQLLNAIQQHVATLQLTASTRSTAGEQHLPLDLRSFTFEYHVNLSPHQGVHWLQGEISWTRPPLRVGIGKVKISGRQRDVKENREYRFTGHFTNNVMTWSSEGKTAEDFTTVLSVAVNSECIAGVWAGRESDRPMLAPVLLSSRELAPDEILRYAHEGIMKNMVSVNTGFP